MKKYIILIIIGIISIASISYIYSNYKANKLEIENSNKVYTNIYNKTISGSELATILNKTLDKNNKNKIEKKDNGYYEDNGINSIIIEIKFKDSDSTFRIEQIAKNGIENFIKLYGNLNFKCTKMEYHQKTNLIKYLFFEEI